MQKISLKQYSGAPPLDLVITGDGMIQYIQKYKHDGGKGFGPKEWVDTSASGTRVLGYVNPKDFADFRGDVFASKEGYLPLLAAQDKIWYSNHAVTGQTQFTEGLIKPVGALDDLRHEL